MVQNAVLADFTYYDIGVMCPGVTCRNVHVWLYCIETEARLKSLENADCIAAAELFYQPVLKYVVY